MLYVFLIVLVGGVLSDSLLKSKADKINGDKLACGQDSSTIEDYLDNFDMNAQYCYAVTQKCVDKDTFNASITANWIGRYTEITAVGSCTLIEENEYSRDIITECQSTLKTRGGCRIKRTEKMAYEFNEEGKVTQCYEMEISLVPEPCEYGEDTSTTNEPQTSDFPVTDTTHGEDYSSCPAEQPQISSICNFEGSCDYGQESCCGQTYAEYECKCDRRGLVVCLPSHACQVPDCDEPATTQYTEEPCDSYGGYGGYGCQPKATPKPSRNPSPSPTPVPSKSPTIRPTSFPSHKPTPQPITWPTKSPTVKPTDHPTANPTKTPTVEPTLNPTAWPTKTPTTDPTQPPSSFPTNTPTQEPTVEPTKWPTPAPTSSPTVEPTLNPTKWPTKSPTGWPTKSPTGWPTKSPTGWPTKSPAGWPTKSPTGWPTPTPTRVPTTDPTKWPTPTPTKLPTSSPTVEPTLNPTEWPTKSPTPSPTKTPTPWPTAQPTKAPSNSPSCDPSTESPTKDPTKAPAAWPSKRITEDPTAKATQMPSKSPIWTKQPTKQQYEEAGYGN